MKNLTLSALTWTAAISVATIAITMCLAITETRDAELREQHACIHYIAYEEGTAASATERDLYEMYAAQCAR